MTQKQFKRISDQNLNIEYTALGPLIWQDKLTLENGDVISTIITKEGKMFSNLNGGMWIEEIEPLNQKYKLNHNE